MTPGWRDRNDGAGNASLTSGLLCASQRAEAQRARMRTMARSYRRACVFPLAARSARRSPRSMIARLRRPLTTCLVDSTRFVVVVSRIALSLWRRMTPWRHRTRGTCRRDVTPLWLSDVTPGARHVTRRRGVTRDASDARCRVTSYNNTSICKAHNVSSINVSMTPWRHVTRGTCRVVTSHTSMTPWHESTRVRRANRTHYCRVSGAGASPTAAAETWLVCNWSPSSSSVLFISACRRQPQIDVASFAFINRWKRRNLTHYSASVRLRLPAFDFDIGSSHRIAVLNF